jgi:hypothetical protein
MTRRRARTAATGDEPVGARPDLSAGEALATLRSEWPDVAERNVSIAPAVAVERYLGEMVAQLPSRTGPRPPVGVLDAAASGA